MKIVKILLLFVLFASCKTEVNKEDNITTIISPFFKDIPNKYEILLLKNKDCLSCENSTSEYASRLLARKEKIFVIAQEIRKVEEKQFYTDKPYLKNTNHVFNDSLAKVICNKLKRELKTTILIKVENDSIIYSGFLREKGSF
ncbi:MAG: hypothetical protein EBR41_02540 [Crocinitomicaceae bacterium]|jgi:hypothetical protein|nr:hypothetical protein [Crocinitomicaceae bacterium]NBW72082.1 hypothetical protein [Flavobacteriia bacterium]